MNPEVCQYLADNDISIQPYDAFIGDLKRRVDESNDIRFVVDEDGTTDAVSRYSIVCDIVYALRIPQPHSA